ncbi:RNA-directed DNA polymerase, eukaryota [Tanacetum coccineum]
MESMDNSCVRKCWGNMVYDHAFSDAVGFCKLVEDSWKNNPKKNVKVQFKKDLEAVNQIIDSGQGVEEDIRIRSEIILKIRKCDEIDSLEMAQKTKIKWAYPGGSGGWLNSDQMHDLEAEVSKDEVKRAVWECGTDKAPGPDGFTFGFFRHFWYLVEKDVIDAVSYFFSYADIPRGCNSSFIALIPKIPDANVVKDFRPISLIGSLYKIIAKILTNRLVNVLGGLVNEVQSAFVANRQILDGPFIINELFQWCKSKKKQTLIFKVDFEKAYDSVRWDFLDEGLFHGIKLHDTVNISHLFYADDAVFVGQWSDRNISTLTYVLECFYLASGLKINMSKSKIMGIHVNNDNVNRAVENLGCLVLKAPFMYLGSTVGGDMHRLSRWKDTIDRVRRRLSKWKMKMLSIGGRLTLVKSVLSSMPIFYMSLFKVPSGILKVLESIRSHFFNGHDISSKKISWVNWNKILDARFFALAKVIKAIHGVDGNLGSNSKGGMKSCWSSIVTEVNALANKGINLMQFLRIKMGNGDSIRLWEDPWHEGDILKLRYPRGYSCSNRDEDRGRGIVLACFHVASCLGNSSMNKICIGVETIIICFFTCEMALKVSHLINRWWDVTDSEFDSYASWKVWVTDIRLHGKTKLMFEGIEVKPHLVGMIGLKFQTLLSCNF